MPEFTLKCPKCGKTTQFVRCPYCGARAKHLFLGYYDGGGVRGRSCRKCGGTYPDNTCPSCGAEYSPAILQGEGGGRGCSSSALVIAVLAAAAFILMGSL